MSAPTVHIVGGGLVGPLMAVYLARKKFMVELYERRPDNCLFSEGDCTLKFMHGSERNPTISKRLIFHHELSDFLYWVTIG